MKFCIDCDKQVVSVERCIRCQIKRSEETPVRRKTQHERIKAFDNRCNQGLVPKG